MGSNKEHKRKKEHKHRHKRKHKRSDSEERSPDAKKRKSDKEHKSKKHHKRHKYDSEKYHRSPSLDSDVSGKEVIEEISIEEEEVYVSRESTEEQKPVQSPEESVIPEGKSVESLSIEDTNRIRAKLGLKPLSVGNSSAANGDSSTKAEFVHAPAEDLWKKKKEAEIREKLQARKEKRNIEKKYSKVKTLGEESDEESASKWVEKSRHKETVLKREKELAQVGDEFGLGDLVKSEFKEKQKNYTEKDLKGLNVEHSLESFQEGQSAVLVIKDKDILDSDNEDVLHSVVIQDKEKAKKNQEVRKRGLGYKAYEDEEVDEMGFFKAKVVLSKYDEEIEGEQASSFTIGERGFVDTTWEQQKESMKQEIRAKGESLSLPPLRLASEYFTAEEMQFKKRKRKVKKTRKREVLKADDLLPLPGDTGGGQDLGSRVKADPDNVENHLMNNLDNEDKSIFDENDAANELQRALEKTRKAKQKKASAVEDEGALKVAQHMEAMAQIEIERPEQQFSTTISLNATDEFCRQLGAQIQTKEPAAVSEEVGEVDMDLDDESEPEMTTQWSSVVPGAETIEKQVKQEQEEHAPIEAEPLATGGLLGALKLAQRKGYLQPESKKGGSTVITNATSHLQAQHYSIEDKNAVDYLDKYAHEKYTKDRGRHDRGMITDFAEKKDYKPKVAIEYVDDRGRVLSAKEAFRKLSHRFHGKGSGKTKQEKRQKKLQEEETMKHMSSTDTPLNTVAMMKSKLKTEASPYIVLSGAGKTLMSGGDSLSKK